MENKSCEEILDLLNQYIDGELGESDTALVCAHLESCNNCQKAYDELLALKNIFADASEEAPAELHESVMAKVKAESQAILKKKKLTRRLGGFAVAAVICLSVLASPAILMIITGGAKASDEAATSISGNRFDGILDMNMTPECEVADDADAYYKSEVEDSYFEDGQLSLSELVQDGKEYKTELADQTQTVVCFKGDFVYIENTEYKYEVSGSIYRLYSSDDEILLEIYVDDEVKFKQVETKND